MQMLRNVTTAKVISSCPQQITERIWIFGEGKIARHRGANVCVHDLFKE